MLESRLEDFIRRAEELGEDDGKFRALLKALNFVMERGRQGHGAGKLVIFTESRVTMTYLRERLIESRWVAPGDITLFSGVNDSKEAMAALARWREEVPQGEGVPPSAEMAVRLALVHEFRTRSRVFISTEAGAKGLNLQFCDTVVNYDLPWNPQRIEQRIGRCHRYKQQHDVTVINFIAKDNEAQRLTFEILSQKLELFGTVLDASDQVLHRSDATGNEVLVSALGTEFEAELRRIYDRARTLEEVTAELRALREKVDGDRRRFEDTHRRTAGLIESHFDNAVQRVFRMRKSELPEALAALDADLDRAVTAYLGATGVSFERVSGEEGRLLRVAASSKLPPELRDGLTAAIGPSPVHTPLHLGHPLVAAAVEEVRRLRLPQSVAIRLPSDGPEVLEAYVGRRGRLRLVKVLYDGFERVEQLVPVAVLDGDLEVLEIGLAQALFRGTFLDSTAGEGGEEAFTAFASDVPTIQADVDVAEKKIESAKRALEEIRTELHHAEGALSKVGGIAVAEEVARLRDAIASARAREQDLEIDADAYKLLRDTLREVENAEGAHLGRALSGPVAARFRELTDGRYGALSLNPALKTEGVRVTGASAGDVLEALSVGTREQLATLIRLAIAEQLKSAIVLDDHLVQTDPQRLAWFREVLRKTAVNTQVVILTCRPQDYLLADELPLETATRDLAGGTLRAIDLSRLVKRWSGTPSRPPRRESERPAEANPPEKEDRV